MITATIQANDFLSFDYATACKVLLPSHKAVTLVLVGCGGTGSWLAPSVARVARLLVEKFNRDVSVLFVDPDTVEPKNVYRQNFCEAEIGRYKAETLAFRYGLAWGVEIGALATRLRNLSHNELNHGGVQVVIGCVDNAEARREIKAKLDPSSRSRWWLDCGNFRAGGQVLIGCGHERYIDSDPWQLPGFCAELPLPTDRHPELLEDEPLELIPNPDNLSCADLAMLDSQSLSINQAIAAIATDYLVRLLLTRDLTKIATYIDLASGSSRSVYITPEAVRK
jgi:PRTRC genetic system ThiF family protein